MRPYCNNLKSGDEVEWTKNGNRGYVSRPPRESSTQVSVSFPNAKSPRYLPVKELRLVVDGVAETVPPVDGEIPEARSVEPPDAEKTESEVLNKFMEFERHAQPVKLPDGALKSGEHIKHYLITFVDQAGEFRVERIAAKGIVTAITIFYLANNETAIVSVVCVL